MGKLSTIFFLSLFALFSAADDEYPGIDNPFSDPLTNYKDQSSSSSSSSSGSENPRSFLLGLEGGLGLFTGGLGATTGQAPIFGIRALYYIKGNVALEMGVGYANHLERLTLLNSTVAEIETILVPVTGGIRFGLGSPTSGVGGIIYPYLGAGLGMYYRTQNDITPGQPLGSGEGSQFGVYVGGGFEFPIVSNTLYLGIDLRYHLIFFFDEDGTLNNNVAAGTRAGDYFSSSITLLFQL